MKKLTVYSASWCGPCKMLKPTLESLQSEGYNIDIIDIDKNQFEAQAKQISSVPTFIVYEGGVEVARGSGAPSEQEIKFWLD